MASSYSREIKPIIDASPPNAEKPTRGTKTGGELADICQLIEQCEARVSHLGVQRVFFTMAFSSRRDKAQSMADMLRAASGWR